MLYPIEYDTDGETIIASLPDLPGVHDEGASKEEARSRLLGAALAMLQAMMDDNEDIPDPSPAVGREVLPLPSQV